MKKIMFAAIAAVTVAVLTGCCTCGQKKACCEKCTPGQACACGCNQTVCTCDTACKCGK